MKGLNFKKDDYFFVNRNGIYPYDSIEFIYAINKTDKIFTLKFRNYYFDEDKGISYGDINPYIIFDSAKEMFDKLQHFYDWKNKFLI